MQIKTLEEILIKNEGVIRVIGDMSPGDILLIQVNDDTKSSEIESMIQVLSKTLPGVRFMIAPKSIEFSILELND